jgi:hypothetical protein
MPSARFRLTVTGLKRADEAIRGTERSEPGGLGGFPSGKVDFVHASQRSETT